MVDLVRVLGFTCIVAWLILECIQIRRFGILEPKASRDVSQGWFGRHPVTLALVIQAFIIGVALILVAPGILFITGHETASVLVWRVLLLGSVLLVIVFGIQRLKRGRQAGLARDHLRLQALSLVAWSLGYFLCFV